MSPVFIDRKCTDCDGKGHVTRGSWCCVCPTCNGMGSIGEYREATPEEMNPYKPTEFGEWMQKARIHVEATYSRLAELTGLRISRLSEIERGKGEPVTEDEKAAIRAHLHGIAIDLRDAEALRKEKVRGAAVDMLAALKEAYLVLTSQKNTVEDRADAITMARAAIAKAEGRE